MKTVFDFYSKFNFRDMVLGDEASEPPVLLKEFFQKDIDFIRKINAERILEVGCGFGRLLKELGGVAKEVIGIDFSKLQLNQARESLVDFKNIKLLRMNAESISFQDKSFDVVMCMNSSLGNMPKIEETVLSEMIRVCKMGGKIIIRVFAESNEVKKAQFQNYQRLGLTNIQDDGRAVTTDEGFYSRRFTKEEVANMFKVVGLECKITKDCDAGYLVVATKI